MVVNLEPISGFILKIKSIPNCLHKHTDEDRCFNIGHLVGKNGLELDVPILI